MVAICLKCNRDVDTLENKNAGHDPNCPTKRTCAKCKKDYFKDNRIATIDIKRVKFTGENSIEYILIDICLSCELNYAKQLGVI